MNEQQQLNYHRIADAIHFVRENFKKQPSLGDIAESVHLSPYHFQRLFSDWAGVSPKKFIQYTSVEYAKRLLKEQQATLLDAASQTGLSGTGRLHDLFISIEGMTPGEFKNKGARLSINHSFAESPFGKLLVASTAKGICHMAFIEDEKEALEVLKGRFANAVHQEYFDCLQQGALSVFQGDRNQLDQVKLHLSATPFQLKVWNALLKIPEGRLSTYGDIAKRIASPRASRAVGTAVGSNPVAFLIPCHRVIRASGNIGGYAWGDIRKTAMIGWEASRQ